MSYGISPSAPSPAAFAAASRLGRLFCVALALASSAVASAAVATATPFGSPSFVAAADWRPVDFHMISARLDFTETSDLVTILPPPNHQLHPALFIGPGAAHAPPYDTEIGSGIAAAGIAEKTVFTVNEFDGNLGFGVFLPLMVIADPVNAPIGLTPDGNTPMIPNSIFPMTLRYVISQNGVPFDVGGFPIVPALDGNLDPPFAVDGHSHFPLFLEEDSTFLAPGMGLPGAYDFHFQLLDTRGNGYVITSSFEVTAVPEPGSILLLSIGTLAVAVRCRGRRGRQA
ncbi:MAG TPA: PEP-CTERM sorting domain-containing protein [Rubrivivax sp.]